MKETEKSVIEKCVSDDRGSSSGFDRFSGPGFSVRFPGSPSAVEVLEDRPGTNRRGSGPFSDIELLRPGETGDVLLRLFQTILDPDQVATRRRPKGSAIE